MTYRRWLGVGAVLIHGVVYGMSVSDIVGGMRERMDAIPPYKSMYRQVTTMTMMPNPLIESGWVYQNGTKSRKEIQSPNRKIVIQNGVGAANDLARRPMDWRDVVSQYQFSIQSETPESWVLIGHYQTSDLTLTVSKSSWMPIEIQLVDSKVGMSFRVTNAYKRVGDWSIMATSNVNGSMTIGTSTTSFQTLTTYSSIQVVPTMSDSLFVDAASGTP